MRAGGRAPFGRAALPAGGRLAGTRVRGPGRPAGLGDRGYRLGRGSVAGPPAEARQPTRRPCRAGGAGTRTGLAGRGLTGGPTHPRSEACPVGPGLARGGGSTGSSLGSSSICCPVWPHPWAGGVRRPTPPAGPAPRAASVPAAGRARQPAARKPRSELMRRALPPLLAAAACSPLPAVPSRWPPSGAAARRITAVLMMIARL